MNGKMSKCRKFVNHGRSLKFTFNLVIHRHPFFIHFQICSLNFSFLSLSLQLYVYNKIYLTYTLLYSLLLCLCAQSLQLYLTLCNLMDCSPPGSSVHGIFLARILEWVVLLQWIFPTQGSNLSLLCLLYCRQILYHLSYQGR